jgi:flagellar biosynthesis/type III secretory pathway protein FliH
MKTRPEVVAERACVLLERMPPSVQVTLCVSPDDLEALERYFQAGGGPLNRITPSLKSDPAISSGSMRLESDAGLINAGLMDTLEEVGRFLIEQARTQMQANSPPGGRGSAS